MQKQILSFIAGVLISGIIVGAILERNSVNRLNKISERLADSEALNTKLTETNSDLLATNTRLTATVGELEERINRENQQHQERLRNIEKGLRGISTGLTESTDIIQSVIEGLQRIREVIEFL